MKTIDSTGLLKRLDAAAQHFPLSSEEREHFVQRGSGPLLSELANIAVRAKKIELVWLLLVAVTAQFPSPDELKRTNRLLRSSPSGTAHRAFLEAAMRDPRGLLLGDVELDIVTDSVVIDVDFCARYSHNTGIQRVVRQTMARWTRDHDVIPVAWTRGRESMRRLEPIELARVTRYGVPYTEAKEEPVTRLVVPFRSTVLLLEVPSYALCEPLEGLAEFSGNKVGLLGYDAIPVVSADTVSNSETDRFVKYLSIVKHADRVAGISATATEEFAGFVRAVGAQGLAGPTTISVPLPVDIPDGVTASGAPAGGKPLVLVVGSQEPRKNHDAIVHAATALWNEGLDFSLRFIGSGASTFTRKFDRLIADVRKQGRDIRVLRKVKDGELLDNYQRASFTVFPSLHEGFGLPVAESLALGVPVITSNYGSTAEIAADGGCLVVNPRSDKELTDAMRRMLTDQDLGISLREEIAARPSRTWDDYADELWQNLVVPLKESRG